MHKKVVIIGAGISGMSSAIYLKRGGIDPIIIENNAPGGVLNIIPCIENYPGFTSISGPDLASSIYKQVEDLGIKILNINIKSIDLDKRIINDDITFDYLIIATGRRSRLLGLANENEYIGKGISTCALCDGNFYKGKDVIVVGGGSSALSEAVYLSNICNSVTIIHRRNSYTGEYDLINKVNNTKNIDKIFNRYIVKYNIDDNRLIGVTLDNGDIIDTSCVFLSIGSIPNSELFDVDKDNSYIIVNDKYETSINYVYAIGDVIKKSAYQLVSASNDGLMVALNILRR